jgi:hypothetical protein
MAPCELSSGFIGAPSKKPFPEDDIQHKHSQYGPQEIVNLKRCLFADFREIVSDFTTMAATSF